MLGCGLNLLNTNLVHCNVRGALESQVDVPVGLAVTKKAQCAVSH
jgi:hypothetical protein